MPGECRPGREIDAHLHGLAAWRTEIVPLQVSSRNTRGLRPRGVLHQKASDDQRGRHH
jgi:hypothetical protein